MRYLRSLQALFLIFWKTAARDPRLWVLLLGIVLLGVAIFQEALKTPELLP